MRAAFASMLALATQSSCALLASANASHSHISAGCVGDPTYAAIDLVVGTLGAGALVWAGTAEESPGWLAVPGVFVLSGMIGSFTSYNCRHPDQGTGTAAAGPPAIYYVPADPPAEPAEPEPEVHLVDPPDPSPPKVRLELDPDYLREHGSAPAKDERVECSIEPVTACPEKQSCVLDVGTHGHCRPDR
jgi:hypothetical protein